jgi:FAD/FMN-containing dehydrogenase
MSNWNAAIQRLRADFGGTLLEPGDPGYATARPIWNAMWNDRRPALIARCTGVADVRAAILFARERAVPIAVRGGGHSIAGKGTCDGGVVLDLSSLKGVRVDPRSRTALVGGGCLWSDVDRETETFGLATPGGVVSHTGVGGFALGGGFGWLSRRFGLTCDNVMSVDLVTAEGRHLRASESENPDLLWALRGGGGNFGVATHFTLKLHEVGPTVLCAIDLWPLERANDAWEAYAELAQDAPEQLGCTLAVMTAPPGGFFPPELQGRKVAGFFGCWSGDPAELEKVLAPLSARHPQVSRVFPLPYRQLQQMVDVLSPPGRRCYCKSSYLTTMDQAVAGPIAALQDQSYSPYSQCEFSLFGGAVARVAESATAFGDRNGRLIYNIVANWLEPQDDPVHQQWARAFFQALQPYSSSAVYVNFLSDEGEERIRAAYGAKYAELARLKRIYDPHNVFQSNQNIRPAHEVPPV